MHRFRPFLLINHRSLHQLQNAGPLCSHLKSRSVIRFSGPETIKFLQGLLTNDVRRPPRPEEKLDRTGSGPGRESGGSVEVFADVDGSILDELLATFKKYRLRAKVDIENVAEDFSCWQRYGENLCGKTPAVEEPEAASVGWGSGADRSGSSAVHGSDNGWQWFKDPRLSSLGFRGIFPSDTTPPLVEADKETDEENYLVWRLEKGVAEGSTEIPKGEAIPLEYNFAGLNAISFDKGCYVGQELIARTHHRGVIRKRLLPMKFLDNNGKEVEGKVAPGLEVINTTSGKKAGTVTTALGARGMGVLRMDEAFKGSGSLTLEGQEDVKVEAIRPDWWPTEWFQEHQQHSAAA
ncbi:hypothetical protein COLO4_23880 [Corchorus olitorius]|uniref:CAF17 C-terminal domain-containing protein n=1 Tax=Corchorus olitorius TaxID=93759 RepID=A0A1R3IE65_9ROSI|nr:hypothetical protein COLO4_23880 [Corchorus olitorius]